MSKPPTGARGHGGARARRGSRARPRGGTRGRSLVDEELELVVGPVAHGGHFVARVPAGVPEIAGTVVFVRHALPGEQVAVRVTEGCVGDSFLRADAVRIHEPAAARVTAPCPYAGPGRCGGCDFQHVELAAQRQLKEDVLAEQLRRVAGIERRVPVEPVPGSDDGLRWRTRLRLHRDDEGRLGLRAHRSRRVVPVADCRIASTDAWVSVDGEASAVDEVVEEVAGRPFRVGRAGFWQAHRGAPELLVNTVLALAQVRPGQRVVDLYAGVGLFALFLAEATGPTGSVVAVEGDRDAVASGAANLADLPWAEMVHGAVHETAAGLEGPVEVVVADPPRSGMGRAVVDAVATLAPRRVVLVACDPASFARDVSLLAERGYDWSAARAFDLFPMTHHFEVVGLFDRGTGHEPS